MHPIFRCHRGERLSLFEIQSKWVAKFHEMRERGIDSCQLAAPFLSVTDDRRTSEQSRPILLIGKATGGFWGRNEFLSSDPNNCIDERRSFTQQHLSWRQENYHRTAFWRYWRKLHEIGAPVIWTNLAKIGVESGNPAGDNLSLQRDLACQTLRLELEEYKPKLVMLVTGNYAGNDIVIPVFGNDLNRPIEFWWRSRDATRPAILWTDHPQGKSTETVSKWLEKARELMA
jgi:hypothetical protein